MNNLHNFDEALRLTEDEEGRLCGQTTPPYANMVGPYGGLISGVFLKAVLNSDQAAGDPVALTVNFCGAIANGEFKISRKLARAGKYLQHWTLELYQEGSIRATATAVMGHHQDTFSHAMATPPNAPDYETLEPLPKGLPLKWIDAYDMRYFEGAPRLTGKAHETLQSPYSALWVRDDPPRPLDHCSLAAMADAFFLRNIHIRGTFPHMGTVTLTTYFHATRDEIEAQGVRPLLGTANSKRMHRNFADQQVELWGASRTLLATSVQMAWHKE